MITKISNCTKILTPRHYNPLRGEVCGMLEEGKFARQEGKIGMRRQTYPPCGLDSQMHVYLRGPPVEEWGIIIREKLVFLGYAVPWINLALLIFRLLCVGFFSLLPFTLENAEMAAQKDRFSRNFVCILILSSPSYPVQSLFKHRISFGWRFLFLKIKRKECNSFREYLNICHMWRSKVIRKLRPNKVEYLL